MSIAAGALLLLVLLCGTGMAAIRYNLTEPPSVELTINGVGLIARPTNVPSCALWFIDCEIQPLDQHRQMYAIWIVWRRQTIDVQPRGPSQRAQITITPPGARRVFAMRMR